MICSIDSLLPRNPKCLIFNLDQQPIVVMLKRILFLHLTMRERSSEFCPSIETLLTNECVYCPIYDLDAELGGKKCQQHTAFDIVSSCCLMMLQCCLFPLSFSCQVLPSPRFSTQQDTPNNFLQSNTTTIVPADSLSTYIAC
jgi:hypothetical protein